MQEASSGAVWGGSCPNVASRSQQLYNLVQQGELCLTARRRHCCRGLQHLRIAARKDRTRPLFTPGSLLKVILMGAVLVGDEGNSGICVSATAANGFNMGGAWLNGLTEPIG